MKTYALNLPQLSLIAATRGMAGAGLGLLLSERVPRERRRAVGWTLLAVGALSTIPLVIQLVQAKKSKPSLPQNGTPEPEREPVGAEL